MGDNSCWCDSGQIVGADETAGVLAIHSAAAATLMGGVVPLYLLSIENKQRKPRKLNHLKGIVVCDSEVALIEIMESRGKTSDHYI